MLRADRLCPHAHRMSRNKNGRGPFGPAPVNSRRTEALLPKSRGSKLVTGFPAAFWRFRADGLPLKGGAMYTPCFVGSSGGRKDISRGFQSRTMISRAAMTIFFSNDTANTEKRSVTMFIVH